MTPLNLRLLFDPRLDVSPPRLQLGGARFFSVTFPKARQAVRLPVKMDGKLAYLIGVLIGDGYVSKPIKRKSHGGGFHWKVVITGPHSYIVMLRRLFFDVFRLLGGIRQDKRKRDAWQLRFASMMLHRFFVKVIGLPQGKKTVHGVWRNLELVREFPFCFLAGLVDSDGYVGENYIGIIQKRFRFLVQIRRFAEATAGLRFKGPYVNKWQGGHITSWIISLHRKEERERFLAKTSRLLKGLETQGNKRL